MDKRMIAAKILVVDAVLLLVVAGIHLWAVRRLQQFLARELNPATYRVVSPPFFLNHVLVAILLVPIGLTTLYSSLGVRKGRRSAWVVCMINAIALLALPVVLFLLMDQWYFTAVPFLIASVSVTIVGLSMA